MGHRILVAYADDGYDLHYAHWLVPPETITAATPYGGRAADGWARDAAADLVDPEGGRLADDPTGTAIDRAPLATGLSFDAVLARLDPLEHEALYVVDPEYRVRTSHVAAVGDGVLVGYDGPADAAYVRGWLAGARATADEADTDGDPDTLVIRALRWLDPDRSVIVRWR